MERETMQLTLRHAHCLTGATGHAAFTTLVCWRGRYYCAYRTAPSHHIAPPGHVVVRRIAHDALRHQCLTGTLTGGWEEVGRLDCQGGDVRDPRFVGTRDALYMLVGVYLQDPRHQDWHGLSQHAPENLLVTHVTWTTDGLTWMPLTPILRPNYWGWSACIIDRLWYVAAYQGGHTHDHGSTIALFCGATPTALSYYGTIYDGLDFRKDGETSVIPHMWPAEPVLWRPTPDTLACLLRTEGTMDIGLSRWPYHLWRWHATSAMCHPSAVLSMDGDILVAGREVELPPPRRRFSSAITQRPARPSCYTTLYGLPPGGYSPRPRLRLPSGGDTGYAGLAPGPLPNTVLISYYTGHATPHLGADVSLALVEISTA